MTFVYFILVSFSCPFFSAYCLNISVRECVRVRVCVCGLIEEVGKTRKSMAFEGVVVILPRRQTRPVSCIPSFTRFLSCSILFLSFYPDLCPHDYWVHSRQSSIDSYYDMRDIHLVELRDTNREREPVSAAAASFWQTNFWLLTTDLTMWYNRPPVVIASR